MSTPPSAIECDACGAMIVARFETVTRRTVATPMGEIATGRRAELVPGFVHADQRHPSGAYWYRRSKRWPDRRTYASLPAVVTCGCGQEVDLPAAGELERQFATARGPELAERVDGLLRVAAGLPKDPELKL